MVSLRMVQIPRDVETGEVLPVGDTMFADMSVAWDDLPTEEKEMYERLQCVSDWKVGLPHLRRRVEQGVPGASERFEDLSLRFLPVERPVVRRHPYTGRMTIKADPGYVSHIIGMSPEESRALLLKVMRLCEVPEYQLRLPWLAEGDIMLFDNYAVEHRVVTDFYDIPAESRTLENIGTQGYPEAHNVLVPGTDIIRVNTHAEERRQEQSSFSAERYLQADGPKKNQQSRL